MLLRWRHNERDGVSNHQSHECLLKRLFRCRSKKTPELRVTSLCEGNSPVTIWWCHHAFICFLRNVLSCPSQPLLHSDGCILFMEWFEYNNVTCNWREWTAIIWSHILVQTIAMNLYWDAMLENTKVHNYLFTQLTCAHNLGTWLVYT